MPATIRESCEDRNSLWENYQADLVALIDSEAALNNQVLESLSEYVAKHAHVLSYSMKFNLAEESQIVGLEEMTEGLVNLQDEGKALNSANLSEVLGIEIDL